MVGEVVVAGTSSPIAFVPKIKFRIILKNFEKPIDKHISVVYNRFRMNLKKRRNKYDAAENSNT